MSLVRSRGYTLIELLIAITLSAIVAALGAGALRVAISYHGRATLWLADREQIKAADRLLGREWSRRSESDLVLRGDLIEFRSDRLARAGAAAAATRVRYACVEEDGGMALERALLAPNDAVAPAPAGQIASASRWRTVRSEILVRHLTDCRFSTLAVWEERGRPVARWWSDPAPGASAAGQPKGQPKGQPAPNLLRLRIATARGEFAPLVYGVNG